MVREQRLRLNAQQLGRRAKEAMQPRRLVGPALGLVAAGAGLAWLWRGRIAVAASPAGAAASSRSPEGHAAAHAPRGRSDLPWVRLLGFVWPLLPQSFRSRVSPNTVNLVMALGLPMAEALFTQPPPPRPMRTVTFAPSTSLAGRWHEVAHLSGRDAGAVQLHFTPRGDGSLDLLESRLDARGVEHLQQGTARPEPGSGGARLTVSRWTPGRRWLHGPARDEWVLHLDDDRGELLLGSPRRDALRLLSRRRRLPPERLHLLAEIARDQGFAVEKLCFVDRA